MLSLQTVLCPVDFSPATARQVDTAADLCRAFGATLVIHHNRHSLGTGASVGWMWQADQRSAPQAALEARLQECLGRVPEGVKSEALLTEGPVSRSVAAVSEAIDADLVVLTAHGRSAEDHQSVTERLLEKGDRAVLVLHEPEQEPRTPRFSSSTTERQVVLAATDLMADSRRALQLGFDLARALPIELHLLHFMPKLRGGRSVEDVRAELQGLVPQELANRVTIHVEEGDAARGIASTADRLSAACIVLGESAASGLRRWFGRDTSREVLRQAHCPVWYVPGHHAA